MCQETGVKSVDGLGHRRVETYVQSQGCEEKPAGQMGGQWERGGMCRVRWRQQLTKITQLPGAVRQARVTIRAAEVRPARGSHCDPEKSSSHWIAGSMWPELA